MKLSETVNKRILLSPLNWGMGHVSRCIGLIRQLRAQQNKVIVACDADQQRIFESYFTDLQFVFHEGYPFEFSGNGNFATDLFLNRRKLLPRFAKEQKEVAEFVDKYHIDLVISDQRYGFFSQNVPSVFVTHQLHLPLKWYQFVAGWLNQKLMRNFTGIWCLDTSDHVLAGNLSRPVAGLKIDYIGWFSRFEKQVAEIENYEQFFVVSGPEPYAEQFFKQVIEYSTDKPGKMACLIPKDYPLISGFPANLEVFIATSWKENDDLFHQSKVIVSRSGYSTLMDLEILDKKAILVPTPGQSEQIYLSQLHAGHENWEFRIGLER